MKKVTIRVNWVNNNEILLSMLKVIGFEFKTNPKVFKEEGWLLNKDDKIIFCRYLAEDCYDCYDIEEFLTMLQLSKLKDGFNITEFKAIEDIREFCKSKRVLTESYIKDNYNENCLKNMLYDITTDNQNIFIMDLQKKYNVDNNSLEKLLRNVVYSKQ
jgi:hypothetical protein